MLAELHMGKAKASSPNTQEGASPIKVPDQKEGV